MRFKKLTLNQEGQWLNIILISLPEITGNKKRLNATQQLIINEAQELIIKGTAMALGYDNMHTGQESNITA
ncbi:hypothetical protein LCGC14_1351210 [marine sediment metagenome]|uniref:Uncharacterized protein n=1 Tax=marine sediment metagenome TaxID=412755 RepID=A0A0F9ND57_9ZZZZ